MNIIVDSFEKATVSLGGACPLRCAHCYITTKQFHPSRKRNVEEVIDNLKQLKEPFTVICISGDTDCFLDPVTGLDLIKQVATSFEKTDIMFTSRLLPGEIVVDSIIALSREMAKSRRLLIPCVSLVTFSYPNRIENPRLVPSSEQRLHLLEQYMVGGLPCFLTLRPTFPFGLVTRGEVQRIIAEAVGKAVAVLGEAFILDLAGEIVSRLGITPSLYEDSLSPLSFLPQSSVWKKILPSEEIEFTRTVCEEYQFPFFLRSMSGVLFLKKYWDFERAVSTYKPGDHLDRTIDSVLP